MKKYEEPRLELLLPTYELLMASDEGEQNPDDFSGALPGWNGEEIVLPPVPIPR